MTKYISLLCVLGCVVVRPVLAEEVRFTAHFTDCSEFAGWGPVAFAPAQKLVPPAYKVYSGAAGEASIVVRAAHCAAVEIPGRPTLPTTLSQIGINVISPDGTGTINNYTLIYVSDNPYLVAGLLIAGAPARWDPGIAYEYTLNSAGTGGSLYVAVPNGGVPAYFIYGTETEPPPNSAEFFLANWWYGAGAKAKEATTIPAISFGTAPLSVYTSKLSELGVLFGDSNTYSNFIYLALRGEFTSGDLAVITTGH